MIIHCGHAVVCRSQVTSVGSLPQSSHPPLTTRLFTLDSVVPNQDPRVNDSDLHQLSYSSAIIASLRSERDMERAAHKRTRREAEDRIAALEAQVRNREAELEACSILTHAETCSRRVHDQPPFCSVHGQPMTRSHLNPSHSDMLRSIPTRHDDMVRAASARNKALEMEVKGLFERVRCPDIVRLFSSFSEAPIALF